MASNANVIRVSSLVPRPRTRDKALTTSSWETTFKTSALTKISQATLKYENNCFKL